MAYSWHSLGTETAAETAGDYWELMSDMNTTRSLIGLSHLLISKISNIVSVEVIESGLGIQTNNRWLFEFVGDFPLTRGVGVNVFVLEIQMLAI